MKKQTLSIIQKQELGIKELGCRMVVQEMQADSLFLLWILIQLPKPGKFSIY